MADAVAERLFNLLAVLLAARKPISETELLENVTGYDGPEIARQKTFERDKTRLRAMGIEIRLVGPAMYQVDRESAFLPVLDLRPSDALVLSLVLQLSLSRAADESPEEAAPLRGALLKLFASYPALSEPAARYPVIPYRKDVGELLSPLYRSLAGAVAARRALYVRYARPGKKAARRHLNPYALFRHDGAAYLVAHSEEREKVLTFRVSRIERADLRYPEREGPDFERPADFRADRYARRRPWDFSEDEPQAVAVHLGAPESLWVHENWEPETEVSLTGDDAVLRTVVRDPEAFGRYLLRFTRFRVESPAALRGWVASRMDAVVRLYASPPAAALVRTSDLLLLESARTLRRKPAGPPEATDRLRRLTVMLPYILSRQGRDGIPLADLAAQFGGTAKKIERDVELLTMCGLPDYGPDRLISWDPDARDRGRVRIEMADYLKRPLRLDFDEASALLAAVARSREILGPAIPRALRSVTERLREALPPGWTPSAENAGPAASRAMASKLKTLLRAARKGEQVEFEYIKLEAATQSRRRVLPELLRPVGDGWHLFGRDLDSGSVRAFRLDGIRDLKRMGGKGSARSAASGEAALEERRAHEGDRVAVRFGAALATWASERFSPLAQKELPGGNLLAVVRSFGPPWLAAKLLPVGADAEVVSPPAYRQLFSERAAAIRDRNR